MNYTFGNYIFEHISSIQPDCDSTGICRFMPQADYNNHRCLPLNRYGYGPFCRFRIPDNMHVEGVYIIALGTNVQYIGECVDLSKRFNMGYGQISPRNCYKGGQETNCRINKLIAECSKELGLWFLKTKNRKSVEAKLISWYKPPWNR